MAWSLAANLQGPAGPSAVSADAGNSARLGTDAKVFVPSSLYVLPMATAKVLGGIKVGAGLSMTADGVLSAPGFRKVVTPLISTSGGLRT